MKSKEVKTESKSLHTKGKWTVKCGIDWEDNAYYNINDGKQNYEEAEANAVHIVNCVNAHDELVEALRSFIDFTDRIMDDDYATAIRNKAKEALKKATV